MNGQVVGANTQEVSNEVASRNYAANSNNPFRVCFHSRNVLLVSNAVNSGLANMAFAVGESGVCSPG